MNKFEIMEANLPLYQWVTVTNKEGLIHGVNKFGETNEYAEYIQAALSSEDNIYLI